MNWRRASKVCCAIAALSLLFAGMSFAADPTSNLKSAISSFCSDLTNLLPVVSMLMVVVGSVVYASGQIMGAETRARANVWATAALTGALMAMLINSVTPPILTAVYGNTVSCSGISTPPADPCTGVICTNENTCSGGTCKCGTISPCQGVTTCCDCTGGVYICGNPSHTCTYWCAI